MFQTTASEISFSSLNISKYDAKRFEQNQKDQEKKMKSESRYCRKAYNWLYKREVGNQPMAYIVQVGYSPKFEVQKDEKSPTGNRQTLVEPFDISFNLDSLDIQENNLPVIPRALFDETYLVLKPIYKKSKIL